LYAVRPDAGVRAAARRRRRLCADDKWVVPQWDGDPRLRGHQLRAELAAPAAAGAVDGGVLNMVREMEKAHADRVLAIVGVQMQGYVTSLRSAANTASTHDFAFACLDGSAIGEPQPNMLPATIASRMLGVMPVF
jgi:hypothetical protein